MTSVLLRDTSGNPIFFIIHVDDITAERAAQAEREKLEGQLRQSAKLEAIATLAGGVAHDFNNLLMGIQGNVSLLRLDLPDTDPRYRRLANIEANVTNAKTLTRQLLGFARGGKYAARSLDLNPLVRETADLFARSRRQLQVEVDLAQGLWPVRADRDQLSEALMNLFVNAWQAMPGGGLLRVTTVNATLAPAEAAACNVIPGDYVRLAVADTGVGMDADTLAKVFDPFFTTRIIGRGAGLGLAATYGIVRHHGGSIQARARRVRARCSPSICRHRPCRAGRRRPTALQTLNRCVSCWWTTNRRFWKSGRKCCVISGTRSKPPPMAGRHWPPLAKRPAPSIW